MSYETGKYRAELNGKNDNRRLFETDSNKYRTGIVIDILRWFMVALLFLKTEIQEVSTTSVSAVEQPGSTTAILRKSAAAVVETTNPRTQSSRKKLLNRSVEDLLAVVS